MRLKNIATTTLLLLCTITISNAQKNPSIKAGDQAVISTPGDRTQATYLDFIKPDPNAVKWKKALIHVGTDHETFNRDALKASKLNALQRKQAYRGATLGNDKSTSAARNEDPNVGVSFEANAMTNGTPPDNSLAISSRDTLVSVDNYSVNYIDKTGNIFFSEAHDDFFSTLGLNFSFFDPRVIYDPAVDRFIMVVLHVNSQLHTASSSKILVCFSKTHDPLDGWHVYSLDGDHFNNTWFDYPNISVSDNELFITGNAFLNEDFFKPLIFQINKFDGYSGGSFLNTLTWDNILDGNGEIPFTLVPAQQAHNTSYGTGMYLVSNESGGGNEIHYYVLTDAMNNNPQLVSFIMTMDTGYQAPADGIQNGNSGLMKTGDSRIETAIHLNDEIHFAFQGEYQNGFTGLFYGRFNVSDRILATTKFGLTNFDYAYPQMASYSSHEDDQTVVIGFLRTGASIFPEFRAVTVDHNMEWSNSTLLRAGDGYVNVTSGDERWGDYTGIARDHDANKPTAYILGCYGKSNHRYGGFIAQVTAPNPGPMAFYSASATSGSAPLTVTFTNQSLNDPTHYSWDFGDGSNSTEVSPTKTFTSKATYPVRLTATNHYGVDVHQQYILVDVLPGVEESVKEDAKVYPNPTGDLFYLRFDLEQMEEISIQILDINGAVVKQLHNGLASKGNNHLYFNKLALANGTYIVRVESQNTLIANEQLIIAR